MKNTGERRSVFKKGKGRAFLKFLLGELILIALVSVVYLFVLQADVTNLLPAPVQEEPAATDVPEPVVTATPEPTTVATIALPMIRVIRAATTRSRTSGIRGGVTTRSSTTRSMRARLPST